MPTRTPSALATAKRRNDADYRDNDARASKTWATEDPAYWKQYRDDNPAYAERNRNLQQTRNRKLRASVIANEDACNLMERCPHCGKPQPFLPRYPNLGICDYCRGALGECAPDDEVSPIDRWVAEAIGDMIACNSEGGFSLDAAKFLNFLSAQVNNLANGNRAAFCRAIGLAEHAMLVQQGGTAQHDSVSKHLLRHTDSAERSIRPCIARIRKASRLEEVAA